MSLESNKNILFLFIITQIDEKWLFEAYIEITLKTYLYLIVEQWHMEYIFVLSFFKEIYAKQQFSRKRPRTILQWPIQTVFATMRMILYKMVFYLEPQINIKGLLIQPQISKATKFFVFRIISGKRLHEWAQDFRRMLLFSSGLVQKKSGPAFWLSNKIRFVSFKIVVLNWCTLLLAEK